MKVKVEDPIIRQNFEFLEKTYNLEFFEFETKMVDGKPVDKVGFTDKATGLKWRNLKGFSEFLSASYDNITMNVIYVKVEGEKHPLQFVPYDWNPNLSELEVHKIKKHYDEVLKKIYAS